MKTNKHYYCDMDGVLADFDSEPNALERFKTEKGFFAQLKPITSNVEKIITLINNGADVYILSASPNNQADQDKISWLSQYLPQLTLEKIIIIRVGENKAKFVKTKGINILFDDYGKNCEQWRNERKNNIAIKVVGEITIA